MDPLFLKNMAEYEKGKFDRSEAEFRRATSRQTFESFESQVSEFEAVLGHDSELGLTIPGSGDSVRIQLRNFTLVGHELICFLGVDTEKRNVRLIQSLSQLNTMLVKVPKLGAISFRIGVA